MTMPHAALAAVLEQTFRSARAEGLSIKQAMGEVAAAVGEFIGETIANRELDFIVGPTGLNAASVVGGNTGDPGVQLEVEGKVLITKTQTAKNFANNILDAAAAAEHDAAVLRWLQIGPGMDKKAAQAAIYELRRFRGDNAERKEPTE